jgi:hypothetical protein
MDVEQRLQRLEQGVRKWKAVTAGLVLVLVVGVTIAATDDPRDRILDCAGVNVWKDGLKVVVLAGWETGGLLSVYDGEGIPTTNIAQNDNGDGVVLTYSAKGEKLVALSAASGNGTLSTYSAKGKELVELGVATGGNGTLSTYSTKGKKLVELGVTTDSDGMLVVNSADGKKGVRLDGHSRENTGGLLNLYNKTGESVVQLSADEYGNGVVYAGNRKGKGRTLRSGP